MLQKGLLQSDIDQFYKDLEGLRLVTPVAELARVSGLSSGNVSEYLNKKKRPSKRLIDSFYRHYKSSINIPRATQAEDSGEPGPGENAPATP